MEECLSCEELWSDTLKLLQALVGQASYDAVIRGLTPKSYVGTELTVVARNDFIAKMTDKHKDTIQNCLFEVVGQQVSLKVEVSEEKPVLPSVGIVPPKLAPSSSSTVVSVKQHVYEENGDFQSSPLNKVFVFENFVSADCNSFAYGHLRNWADMLVSADEKHGELDPRRLTVIWGDPGLGKSHLAQAFVKDLHANPFLNVGYVTADNFFDHYMLALGRRPPHLNRMAEMNGYYKARDVLVVDDVQKLLKSEKKETIAKFFEIFNYLYDLGRMIVLVCDEAPETFTNLDERFGTRAQWGATIRILQPDPEAFGKIIQKMIEVEGVLMPSGTAERIAKIVDSNPRIAQGAVYTLCSWVSLHPKRALTPELVVELLEGFRKGRGSKSATIPAIIEAVSAHRGHSVDEIAGPKRTAGISLSRKFAMSLCRQLTDDSLSTIGNYFSGKDHGTVHYALRKLKEAAADDPSVLTLINVIRQEFGKEPIDCKHLPPDR